LLQQCTLENVMLPNTEKDAWVVFSGGVYNVTSFMKMHPGGKEILLDHLGQDITEMFVSNRIHSHSEKAFRILDKYCIGFVDNSQLKRSNDTLASLINFNLPILPQVINMDPAKYQPWLTLANGSSKMRIFESDFCEFFSRYPWWYIFPMWIPVILYTTSLSWLSGNSLGSTLAAFFCGVFGWSFVEYMIHRFLFHVETSGTWSNLYHLFAHGLHHLSPLDPSRLTFPPVFSVFIGFGFWQLFMKIQPYCNLAEALYGGFACGYMLYDTCHFYFHHESKFMMKLSYLQWMKTRHLRHHYKDHTKNFGVTSPFFDIVFGTAD